MDWKQRVADSERWSSHVNLETHEAFQGVWDQVKLTCHTYYWGASASWPSCTLVLGRYRGGGFMQLAQGPNRA